MHQDVGEYDNHGKYVALEKADIYIKVTENRSSLRVVNSDYAEIYRSE